MWRARSSRSSWLDQGRFHESKSPLLLRSVTLSASSEPVSDLRQSRRLEIVNGSKPYSAASIGLTPRPRHQRLAVLWVLSPHPLPAPQPSRQAGSPLPWREGEPFSPRRTIQTRRLSTARCAPFPLPEGEGQGEGKRCCLPSPVSDQSRNCRTGRVLRQSRSSEMAEEPSLI